MEPELPPNLQISSVLPSDFGDYRVDDAAAMQALSAAEDGHFWHRSRNALIVGRLQALGLGAGEPFVELGCGGGAVAAALSEAGFEVVGVDGHVVRLREAARRAPKAQFWAHDLSRGPAPLAKAHYSAAGLFDVIEHLDAPAQAITDALALVKPGGLLVGTVPALMSLWSTVDEVSGHKRRYSRATLVELLGAIPGASLLEVLDFNRHLVPVMWLQRRWVSRKANEGDVMSENLAVPSKPVNAVFELIASAEQGLRGVLEWTGLPGASLWFALKKQG
jgi:SAM-dependent methyltransferase